MRSAIRYLVPFLLGVLCGAAFGADPSSELQAAMADAAAQQYPRTTRYFSAYNLPAEERKATVAVLDFVLNSVSRAATIQHVRTVGSGDSTLYAIDLQTLGIEPKLWESLYEDGEPYWHIKTRVIDPRTGKQAVVTVPGGWVPPANSVALYNLTGSNGAIVRADWFIQRVTSFKHYYAFAGVPDTLDGWYKLLGVDAKTIVELSANHGANVFVSGVTKKARRLSRWQGPQGGAWQTYDSIETKVDNDPFRNPTFTGKFDALEAIAAKANGLHLFGIFNGAGKRVDTVPDRVAKDDSDPHGDGVLQPMISCVRCHGANGFKPFSNDQRKLMESTQLLTQDPKLADRLASFYQNPKLDRGLARDNEDYADAVARATSGMKVVDAAESLAKIVRAYEDPVDTAKAVRELATAGVGQLVRSNDPVLLAVRSGIPVTRPQFESAIAEAMVLSATEWNR